MSFNDLLAAARPKPQTLPEQLKKEFARNLGNNIAAKRESLNLGQRDLAWCINSTTAVSTISRWENAATMPDAYSLYQLSNIFGCSCDELLSGSSATHDLTLEQVLAYVNQADPDELSELLAVLQKTLSK